jgi:hypothetical protein
MKTWTDWETVSHHVSICGRVLDPADQPLPGVHLSLFQHGKEPVSGSSTKPAEGRRGSAKLQQETSTPAAHVFKRTESRSDGVFFFLDCPDGRYTVKGIDPRSGMNAEQQVAVVGNAMNKRTRDRGIEEGYGIEFVLKK